MKKNIIDNPAPTGRVTSQDRMILPTTFKSIAESPLARPTPRTAPTNVCVVDIGRPVPEARTTVVAAASSAAKPRLGVSSVISVSYTHLTLPTRDDGFIAGVGGA